MAWGGEAIRERRMLNARRSGCAARIRHLLRERTGVRIRRGVLPLRVMRRAPPRGEAAAARSSQDLSVVLHATPFEVAAGEGALAEENTGVATKPTVVAVARRRCQSQSSSLASDSSK